MGWQTLPGVVGKVYRPESGREDQKHACADCYDCQHCGKERCRLCRSKISDTLNPCLSRKEEPT